MSLFDIFYRIIKYSLKYPANTFVVHVSKDFLFEFFFFRNWKYFFSIVGVCIHSLLSISGTYIGIHSYTLEYLHLFEKKRKRKLHDENRNDNVNDSNLTTMPAHKVCVCVCKPTKCKLKWRKNLSDCHTHIYMLISFIWIQSLLNWWLNRF